MDSGPILDHQAVFNWIFTATGAVGGWILKVIWDAIGDLKREIRSLDTKMHDDFVRRDDFKDAVAEIKRDVKDGFASVQRSIGQISDKLDDKADK